MQTSIKSSLKQLSSEQPEPPDIDVTTGSMFDLKTNGSPGVLHWKRAFVHQIYPLLLLCMDILLIVGLFAIATSLRYDTHLLEAMSRRILLVMVATNVLGVALIGGYSYHTNIGTFRFISEHVIVSAGVFIGVFFVIYSFVAYGVRMNSGRSVIVFTLLAFPVLSIFYRSCLARLKQAYQKAHILCLIGDGGSSDLYRRLVARHSRLKVIVYDPSGERVGRNLVADDPKSPVYQPLDDLEFNSSINGQYVESYVVSCPLDDLPPRVAKRLAVAQFSGNNVCTYEAYLREKMMIIPPGEVTMGWALERGFLMSKNMTFDRVKRFMDIAFGLGGLILFSPLFLVIALLVKFTSKGPVIFTQSRVGKREVPFTLYKFRSMRVGSERGSKYTSKNDNRITPVGKFLRKTRLDEIPQFWNVLKGDLSLIGPRAEWTELVKDYERKFPYYHFRHAVKPGITGWAQVNYSYGESDEDTIEKLNYDLYYVRKHSFVLDAVIIVKTVYIVLFGRGQ